MDRCVYPYLPHDIVGSYTARMCVTLLAHQYSRISVMRHSLPMGCHPIRPNRHIENSRGHRTTDHFSSWVDLACLVLSIAVDSRVLSCFLRGPSVQLHCSSGRLPHYRYTEGIEIVTKWVSFGWGIINASNLDQRTIL